MMLVIDDLREIARCCQAGEPLDERLTRWLGNSLKSFLDQDKRTIEEALGLQAPPGGVPWHLEEALRKRDAALRELAAGFSTTDSLSAQAKQIHSWAIRYAASAWRFDRNDDDMPAHYRGTAKALLWRAFKSGARMPICERQLRNILAHQDLGRKSGQARRIGWGPPGRSGAEFVDSYAGRGNLSALALTPH